MRLAEEDRAHVEIVRLFDKRLKTALPVAA